MNSRSKGKRAELEFAAFLRSEGFDARRGCQFQGGDESPDIVSSLPFHVEVKRVERLNLRDATAQAEGDCGGRPWLVAHRWNHGPWLITMRADAFLTVAREALPSGSTENFGQKAARGRVTAETSSEPGALKGNNDNDHDRLGEGREHHRAGA